MAKKTPTKPTALKKRQDAFLEILSKAAGNVTVACKKADINRSTYYDWMENPDFADQAAEIKESLLDFAETALMTQLRDGNMTAIIFYLKTQGKKRGYIEQPFLEVNVNQAQNVHDLIREYDKANIIEHKPREIN